ncbi:Uncharacterised protein r2_g3562 [Pycnogonum litorale]
MSGQEQKCKGVGNVQLQSGEIGPVNVDIFVADIQPLGFDFILGMTGIQALGTGWRSDHTNTHGHLGQHRNIHVVLQPLCL